MAQTKKRRRRKHRGTQAGPINRGRGAQPRSRKEAQGTARSRQAQKRDQEPTWRGAIVRGLVASALFFVLVVLVFKNPPATALALSVLMLAFYIPMGYYIDRFFWQRRQRQQQAEREQRKAS